jgi:pyruvate formate lyase activating enzyme
MSGARVPDVLARLSVRLAVVLEAIGRARAMGYWVEVVTLVVTGFNDDLQRLRWISRQLAGIDRSIPWHLNAFYPRYGWQDRPAQRPGLLTVAAGSAYARGLRYVYVGNLADRVTALSHTRCPGCQAVVERRDYRTVSACPLDGRCAACGGDVPGVRAAPAAAPLGRGAA